MVTVFLTHRQMGESEAYYRIIPNMLMKDSNVKAVFAQTGFNPSRYLEKIDDKDVDNCEKVVEVEGRQGKYHEKPSLYEKYLRRDCKIQPQELSSPSVPWSITTAPPAARVPSASPQC